MSKKTNSESYKVAGTQVVSKVKEIIQAGNVRRVVIKDKNGKTLFMIPVTFGVIGAVLAPVLAAVAAVTAFVTECTITVERTDVAKARSASVKTAKKPARKKSA